MQASTEAKRTLLSSLFAQALRRLHNFGRRGVGLRVLVRAHRLGALGAICNRQLGAAWRFVSSKQCSTSQRSRCRLSGWLGKHGAQGW